MPIRIDLTDKVFGDLTVIEQAPYRTGPKGAAKARWFCRCVCGRVVTVASGNLTSCNTTSCGCLKKKGRKPNYTALALLKNVI